MFFTSFDFREKIHKKKGHFLRKKKYILLFLMFLLMFNHLKLL